MKPCVYEYGRFNEIRQTPAMLWFAASWRLYRITPCHFKQNPDIMKDFS
jgi:hypothetical protein